MANDDLADLGTQPAEDLPKLGDTGFRGHGGRVAGAVASG
jgi:hypothetical protein